MPAFDVPISLFSIPIVYLLAIVPHVQKNKLAAGLKLYNNAAPRTTVASLKADSSIDPELVARVARLEGAHTNGLEAFPLWTAAVLVGNVCKVDNLTLNVCSILYIVSRLVYNYLYANGNTRAMAGRRTLTWMSGVVISLFLLIRSPIKQL